MWGLLPGILAGCTANGAWDDIAGVLEPANESDSSGDSDEGDDALEPDPVIWERHVEITVQDFGNTALLSDFPVMVRLDGEVLDYQLLRTVDGGDIGFYEDPWSESSVPLPHTVSLWNSNGISVFWVQIPTLLPGTKTIHLYYGSDENRVDDVGSRVWENGYVLVMHFDDADDPFVDNSPFGNDGVGGDSWPGAYSSPTIDAGSVGFAARFLRDEDAVIVPASQSLATMNPRYLSMLLRYDAPGTGRRIIGKSEWFLSTTDSSGGRFQSRTQFNDDGDGNDVFREWGDIPDPGSWRHVGLYWSGALTGTSLQLRIDNAAASVINGDNALNTQDDDSMESLVIGNGEDVGSLASRSFPGSIDELRISRTPRSESWLTAEYLSVTDQLLVIGVPEAFE